MNYYIKIRIIININYYSNMNPITPITSAIFNELFTSPLLFDNVFISNINNNTTEHTEEEHKEIKSNRTDTLLHDNLILECYQGREELVKKDLFCSICQNIIDNVVLTYPCNHKFCRDCIMRCKIRREFKCPNCRSNIVRIIHSKSLNKLLDETIIKCRYEGCDKTMKRKEYKSHLSNECKFVITKCVMCKNEIRKINMNEHMSKCIYRRINCDKCKSFYAFKDRKKHMNICIYREHRCVWCGIKGEYYKVSKHELFCDLMEVVCQNCNSYFYNKDIKEHLKICTSFVSCPQCNKLVNSFDIVEHNNIVHKLVKCNNCLCCIPFSESQNHKCI